MINIALNWLNQGIATIPISYRSKRPDRFHLPNGSWERYKTHLPTRQEIIKWFSQKYINMAVICGWQNLVIVDFDNMPSFDLWMNAYGINGYADSYHVFTGRGVHYYFFVDDFPPHTMKWAGGEIKASGYCLCPPSIHPSGRAYTAAHDDLEIMCIGSLSEIFPGNILTPLTPPSTRPKLPVEQDIYAPSQSLYDYIKTNVRILSFFDKFRKTGDGWYTVKCPLHKDGHHLSGWIDDNRNRFGCHACISGSLSVIDFYMRLKSVNDRIAVQELRMVC